jgi:hypothetical protein
MTPVIQAALERLKAEGAWTHVGYDCPDLSSELADLITAVDALYPEGYRPGDRLPSWDDRQMRRHLNPYATARQALIALCKEIAP